MLFYCKTPLLLISLPIVIVNKTGRRYGTFLVRLSQKIKTMRDYHEYKTCIDACLKCAAICDHCASSCTREDNVKMMAKCIQLDMECATVCYASAKLMSLGSDRAKDMCVICADICNECSNECSRHDNEHCRECAKACRTCADECMKMAAS